MAYLLFTINIVVVILGKHLENYWRTALNKWRCYYIVMVKTLKEVRIQPGPSVRFEQSEKYWTALCEKKRVNLSTGRKFVQHLWRQLENKTFFEITF